MKKITSENINYQTVYQLVKCLEYGVSLEMDDLDLQNRFYSIAKKHGLNGGLASKYTSFNQPLHIKAGDLLHKFLYFVGFPEGHKVYRNIKSSFIPNLSKTYVKVINAILESFNSEELEKVEEFYREFELEANYTRAMTDLAWDRLIKERELSK